MDFQRLNNILKGLSALEEQAHETSRNFGYWDKDRNPAEVIAQVHMELSESLSAIYDPEGSRSQKIPQFTNVEEHLADAVIRIFDLARGSELHVAAAVCAKLKYNEKLAAVTKATRNQHL